MQLTLSLSRDTHVAPSPRVMQVATMFGLGVDETKTLNLIPPTTIHLRPNSLIFITGPSGGGKSSLLALIAQATEDRLAEASLIRFDALPPLPDLPLVDALSEDTQDDDVMPALRLLSLVGLADAFIMLRKPSQLSEGQRYRLQLAQALALSSRSCAPLCIILADEFGATLDRITAKIIARQIRKWTRTSKTPLCVIAATMHDDLLESLEPDLLVEKGLGTAIEVVERQQSEFGRKKADQTQNRKKFPASIPTSSHD